MPAQPDAAVGELAELRRRAYGPEADIHGDPSAQARLAELEDAERGGLTFSGGPVAVEPPAPEEQETRDAAPEPASTSDVDGVQEPAEEASPPVVESRFRRRLPWLVAAVAGVVAVASLAFALTEALSHPRPEVSLAVTAASDKVAVPDLDQGMLDFLGVTASALEYRGAVGSLDVWTVEGRRDFSCLVLSTEGQLWNQSCAVKPLPTMLDIVADRTTLSLKSSGLDVPTGSFVRFLWDGGTVDVYVVRATEDA
ncbi:hypothetical protein AAIB33_07095 [Microbacterium sp. AZCO]|uniref:hypothetical protein n=1 Tax=Microbacterium sp. AZCO TaxID=3142976 RepID=UPI0031F3B9BC